jgi:hypothetical protein
VLAVTTLDIDRQGLLDHIDWLRCAIDIFNSVVVNLLHCTVIKFVECTVDGYFYIVCLGLILKVLNFFRHWILLFHCLAVGVIRAEKFFENSEGITIVDVARYLVWTCEDAVMESSITVSVVQSPMPWIAEDFVSFTNLAKIQLELRNF